MGRYIIKGIIMRTIEEIKTALDEHESHQTEKGSHRYRFQDFDHCDWAIALKRILENLNEEVIIQNTIDLINNFNQNKSNLRGYSDATQIKANL
jgi:transcriptional/translational regulatory protein YebC/TACO1